MKIQDVRELIKSPKLRLQAGDDWKTVWAKTTVFHYESNLERCQQRPFPEKAREAVRKNFLNAYVFLLDRFLGE